MNEFIANFHFLRPLWLSALLLLPFVSWWRQRSNARSDWGRIIDPELLTHLQSAQQSKPSSATSWSLIVALCLLIVALAGPSWKKIAQPTVQVSDNLVVVLDLSLSMLADDQAPSRLTRAKQKIQDLLKLRKEGNTALIAFSGDAHIVTPLTDDIRTIETSLGALDPFIMPVIGSRPDFAIEKAVGLFEQAGTLQGRIIFIGDDISEKQAKRIGKIVRRYTLDIIAVGTAQGSPIPIPQRGYLRDDNGAVVIPQTNFARLSTIARDNKGMMVRLSLDDSDLEQLDVAGDRLRQAAQRQLEEAQSGEFDQWHDMGFIFLFAALPFVLFAHRQGALALLLLCILPSENSYAISWQDLWQTQNQQAQQALENGDAERAAELFISLEHRANALYQAGKYEEAAKLYQELGSAHYNRANALAKSQRFDEALAAYEQALALQPDHQDAAHNKQLIEELLQQQAQQNQQQQGQEGQQGQQQNSQNGDQSQARDQSGDQSQQGFQTNQPQPDNTNTKPDDQGDTSTDQGNEDAVETQAGIQQEPSASQDSGTDNTEGKQQAVLDALSEEEKQSYEQWMRRVPDDPSGLLRRKFEYQSRERSRPRTEEGDPLW